MFSIPAEAPIWQAWGCIHLTRYSGADFGPVRSAIHPFGPSMIPGLHLFTDLRCKPFAYTPSTSCPGKSRNDRVYGT